jgi:hypothetical protein
VTSHGPEAIAVSFNSPRRRIAGQIGRVDGSLVPGKHVPVSRDHDNPVAVPAAFPFVGTRHAGRFPHSSPMAPCRSANLEVKGHMARFNV